MPSKYYEKGEYFISEKEIVNGVRCFAQSREWEDSEEWQRGRSRLDNERTRELWIDRDPWASRFPPISSCFPTSKPISRLEPELSRRSFDTRSPREAEIRRPLTVEPITQRDPYHSTSPQQAHSPYYSVQQRERGSENGSRHEVRHVTPDPVVSRPGSPGPVAGVGDIVNTDHGFTIQLDVKHFRPEDIRVLLTGETLTVTGERSENAGQGQTLRRSFQRKYSIPSDIRLDSITSHLSDTGFLVINGSRRGWQETNISMHPAERTHSSLISNV